MIFSNHKLHITLTRRNLEICEHSSFFSRKLSFKSNSKYYKKRAFNIPINIFLFNSYSHRMLSDFYIPTRNFLGFKVISSFSYKNHLGVKLCSDVLTLFKNGVKVYLFYEKLRNSRLKIFIRYVKQVKSYYDILYKFVSGVDAVF